MKRILGLISWPLVVIGGFLCLIASHSMTHKKGKCDYCPNFEELSRIKSDYEGDKGWACEECRKRICSENGTFGLVSF